MFGNIKHPPPEFIGHKHGRFITSADGFLKLESGDGIDLHQLLTAHKKSIQLMPIHTNIMRDSGLRHGGYAFADTVGMPVKGSIVAIHYNGRIVIRRLEKSLTKWTLLADDPREEKLLLTEFADYKLIGVVTFAIDDCRRLRE